MDKYNVTVIDDDQYEVESDDVKFTSTSILMYRLGKLEGAFPIKKTSIIINLEDEEDPHTKYKNV